MRAISVTAHCCLTEDNTPCPKNNWMHRPSYQADLHHIPVPSPFGHLKPTTTLLYLHPTISLDLSNLLKIIASPSNPVHQREGIRAHGDNVLRHSLSLLLRLPHCTVPLQSTVHDCRVHETRLLALDSDCAKEAPIIRPRKMQRLYRQNPQDQLRGDSEACKPKFRALKRGASSGITTRTF